MSQTKFYQGNCSHCGQRYSNEDVCCQFCGGPIPVITPREELRFYPEASYPSADTMVSCFSPSVQAEFDASFRRYR